MASPVLGEARRVGILGGSFDPVHVGHLHVARSAQTAFELDHIVFIPAARPPHKPGRQLADGAHRTAMLALALEGRADWSFDTIELEREGLSFTIDTVRSLPERLGLAPDCELFLLIGWDNLTGLERWREARELLASVQPVVVYRGPARAPETPQGGAAGAALSAPVLEHLRTELGDELYGRLERGLLPIEPVGVSSTSIRTAFAAGGELSGLGDVLPPGVGEYIRAAGLYSNA